MDNREFLQTLNDYLVFNNAGPGKIAGEIKSFRYEICFVSSNLLNVHTAVKLFGDAPFKDHIENAFSQLDSFTSYTLDNDNIDLLADLSVLSEDAAFSITANLTTFSEALASYGYKSSFPEPRRTVDWVTGEAQQEHPEIIQQPEIQDEEEEPELALPKRFGFGMLGAFIGAAVGMGFWVLISMLNYMFPFILGAIIVVLLPLIFYELFAKTKTSALQLGFCLFLSVVGLLLGDRLIWTFNLLSWYDDITFSTAYWEVPHIVEDGIVDAFDYYQDYIVMIGSLLIFYVMIVINYIKGGKTILELLSSGKRR